MDLNDFFSGKINLKPHKIVKPAFSVTKKTKEEPKPSFSRDRDTSLDYSFQLKQDEENATLSRILNQPIDKTLGIKENQEFPQIPPADEIYTKYEFDLPVRDLPIATKRLDILKELEKNGIIMIRAATGSGKSSQVPQYILEEAHRLKRNVNIIITQPRRISAQSLANRVANERKCEIGSLVGYQIGHDRKVAKNDTRILYCTVGVFLQKLVNEKSLAKWTHVIIDEIHERDLDMDFVLLIIRRIVRAQNSSAKIILMSATMQTEEIANYFKIFLVPRILDLDVKRPFPTKVSYLDEFTSFSFFKSIQESIDLDYPGIDHNLYAAAIEILDFLISKNAKSFLIFLPGWHEIETLRNEIMSVPKIVNNFEILQLHSMMGHDNLDLLFDARTERKIILATNIAESSITIPSIDIIIDFCLTKELMTDTSANLTQLKLTYASKANLVQREGRVGRTKKGQVVRMIFEKHFYLLRDEAIPEMQRTSLETVVLKSKKLNMGQPVDILGLALNPPSRPAIKDAILVLKELGALTRYKNDCFDFSDGDLTFSGEVMSNLPIDVRLSKLILLGYVFKVLDDAIIVASGLSVRSIFRQDCQKQMDAFLVKFEYGSGSSDAIAILNVYKEWRRMLRCIENDEECIKRQKAREFYETRYLDKKSLNEMQKQIEDIHKRLKNYDLTQRNRNENNDRDFLLKICIAGAFYPNYYIFGGQIPEKSSFDNLNYKNPSSCVTFTRFPNGHKGKIYKDQIAKQLRNNSIITRKEDAEIHFDSNSSRIVVEFKNLRNDYVKVPGDVKFEVYKALRFARLYGNNCFSLNLIPLSTERYYLHEKNKILNMNDKELQANRYMNWSIYPKYGDKVHGRIIHVISPGKFYIQPKEGHEKLNVWKARVLNESQLIQINDVDEFVNGKFIIVKIHKRGENKFCRAQIVDHPYYTNMPFKARLIDYGEVIECSLEHFYTCNANPLQKRHEILMTIFLYPPMCYEAKLAQCKPAVTLQTGWTIEARDKFVEIIRNNLITIDVYSFNKYDRVAAVILRLQDEQGEQTSVNNLMMMNGFAETSNESYIFNICRFPEENKATLKNDHFDFDDFSDAPRERETVKLSGPFSNVVSATFEKSSIYLDQGDIMVDISSINGVLIDPYPFDGIRKVLVAANRTKNNNEKVVLRHTTVMPHVTGIGSILSLIFSPTAELRYDKNFNRFTSVLSGMGCSYDKQPYFVEHDNLIYVDADIDNLDIQMINELREIMSEVMDNFNSLRESRQILCDKACETLLKIMTRSRTQMGVTFNDTFQWSGYDAIKTDANENLKMFPRLTPRLLIPLSLERWNVLTNLNNEFEKKAKYNARDEDLRCVLCDEEVRSERELKIHVLNLKHVCLAIRLKDHMPDEVDDKKAVKRQIEIGGPSSAFKKFAN